MSEAVVERLVGLVRRELGADDVRVLDSTIAEPEATNVLVARLADGRHLVASFLAAPADRAALARRLEMLALTFAGALDEPAPSRARPPTSLHDELRALALRARALDALVVDAQSPILWGSAAPRARVPVGVAPTPDLSRRQLIDPDAPDAPQIADNSEAEVEPEANASEIARQIAAGDWARSRARAVAETVDVHKGKHLRHVESSDGHGLYVVSFLGIYLLVLAFDGPFDELRTERAASDALPVVERLVQALPPHDPGPQPMGSVVAFLRPR